MGLQCKESSIKGCCKGSQEYETVSKIKEIGIGEHSRGTLTLNLLFN